MKKIYVIALCLLATLGSSAVLGTPNSGDSDSNDIVVNYAINEPEKEKYPYPYDNDNFQLYDSLTMSKLDGLDIIEIGYDEPGYDGIYTTISKQDDTYIIINHREEYRDFHYVPPRELSKMAIDSLKYLVYNVYVSPGKGPVLSKRKVSYCRFTSNQYKFTLKYRYKNKEHRHNIWVPLFIDYYEIEINPLYKDLGELIYHINIVYAGYTDRMPDWKMFNDTITEIIPIYNRYPVIPPEK